jgi:hypothetical protein
MTTIKSTASDITNVEERSVESSASAVEWAAIFAGGVAALGLTAILVTLGPGFGLAAVSPWSFKNPTPTTFGTAAAIWLIVTQWLSSAFGGYLTGRLRKKWVGIRTDEVVFRDTAHGLLAWALATLIMASLVTLASITTAGVAASVADTASSSVPATAEATEQARKLGIAFAFTTSLSLSIGAFVAAAAGALGGFHRDDA